MAIALDADFRSLKTGPKPESAERAPSAPLRGEAFANQLLLARDAGRSESRTQAPETATVSYGGLVVPMHPADSLETPPAEDVSPDVATAALPDAPADLVTAEITLPEETSESIETPDEQPDPAAALPIMGAASEPQAAKPPIESPAPDAPVPDALMSDSRAAGAAVRVAAVEAEPETGPVELVARTQPAPLSPSANIAGPVPEQTAASVTKPVPVPAPQPSSAPTADLPVEAVAAVAAVTQAMPKQVAATPERAAATGLPVLQAAKTGPKAAELTDPKAPAPEFAEPATPDFTSDVPGPVAAKPAPVDAPGAAPTATSSGLAAAGPSAAPVSAPAPAPVPMTPTQAVITASPAQLIDIFTQSAEDGQSDRIVVQLDPPELGRVSIDFKFDAAGLQHVTITGETPEAMRQLRQMHSELVQSLERQGLNSQNMTFQHQQQNAQQGPNPGAMGRPALAGGDAERLIAAAPEATLPSKPRTLSGGRLDIRL